VTPAGSATQPVNAAEIFRTEFGHEPQGIWSAPGRVNLIGEHTDYNGGYVLPFAIDLRTQAAAARRDDDVIAVRSGQQSGPVSRTTIEQLEPGRRTGWADYVFGTVWALREAGHDVNGLDVVIDSSVPSGSGLSSSAAIECAIGLAALELYGIEVSGETLARIAQRAENAYVGVPCGLMDQMASSVCRADHALFFDVRDDVREHVPFAPAAQGLAMLVIDTRANHAHADGGYAQRRQSCEEAAAILGVSVLRDIDAADLDDALAKLDDAVLRKRTRHVVTEDARVLSAVGLLRHNTFAEIGPLLTASHASLRDDFEVSCAELDVAVESACAAGALGARMTGGGFGGSAIALVTTESVDDVTEAVTAEFASRGFTAPRLLQPGVDGGARRES
jgi:galactokinase